MKLPPLCLALVAACAGSSPPPESEPAKPAPQAAPTKKPGASRGGAQKDLEAAIKAARANDLAKTIELCRSAIEKDPNLEQAYLLLGDSCAQQNDVMCEKDAYEKGVAALPMSAALLNEHGLFLLTVIDDNSAALAELEKAHQLAKEKDPKYAADLAYAYAANNKLAEADALVKKARAADPKSFYVANAAGEILLKKRDFKGAAESFRSAVALAEDPIVAANVEGQLAFVLALDGQYKDALAIWEKRIAAAPNDQPPRMYAAEILLKMDRAKDALAHLDVALKGDDDNPQLLQVLLKTQLKLGDKKGAEATKKKLAALGVKP